MATKIQCFSQVFISAFHIQDSIFLLGQSMMWVFFDYRLIYLSDISDIELEILLSSDEFFTFYSSVNG